jgi:hypothetical protein
VPLRPLFAPVLAAALLTACSSESEEPKALPPVTTSPTVAASEPADAVPPAAQEQTPEGAAEFARFFYAEVRRAFIEKDPEIIRRLSAPGCEACDRFVASLTKLRDNNERTSDFAFEIVVAEAPASDGPEARVDVIYNSPTIQRYNASGEVIYEEPAAQGAEIQMTLTRAPEGWLVQEVESV